MNDKLIMANYLMILKSTIEVYVHGTIESSNSDIKELLNSCLNDTLNHQRDTYNLMSSFGWYNISNIDKNEISNSLSKQK